MELEKIKAYNSAVLAAYENEIITYEEMGEYLINPMELKDIYLEVHNKAGSFQRFRDFMHTHIAKYLIHGKKELPENLNESEAIIYYHRLISNYFGKTAKVIGGQTVNVIMENCPYASICNKTGCIRKYAIESAIEVITGKKASISVEKEIKEDGKATYEICVLSYNPNYDEETIKILKLFSEIEKDALKSKPELGDKLFEEGLEHFIK